MIDTISLNVMDFDQEQLNDLRAAVVYYMQRNISIRNPRYEEYEDILKKLNKTLHSKSRQLQKTADAQTYTPPNPLCTPRNLKCHTTNLLKN